MAGIQVKNGKAFEYALAKQYYERLLNLKLNVILIENRAIKIARNHYNEFPDVEKLQFDQAAIATIDTLLKLEPNLMNSQNENDVLSIFLNNDADGINGDVRDVVLRKELSNWEIGFSAKNNNDAVKHSRLSSILDFGKSWFDCPCSPTYWADIQPIFHYLDEKKREMRTWEALGNDKIEIVYKPLLKAFRKELLFIDSNNENIPQKLIQYLIGRQPFYKIIKDDNHNMVIVKAFNIGGQLNQDSQKLKTKYRIPHINLPTRIIEFDFMRGRSDNTLDMVLDGGWEISFRIHNASSNVENSLKFDIQLLGNPPILFTQHLFQ